MSDDATNLDAMLAAHDAMVEAVKGLSDDLARMIGIRYDDPVAVAAAVVNSGYIAARVAEARLIGAAMAHTDAIAAHAELVERVEGLVPVFEARYGIQSSPVSLLRALIDPEATP